MLLAYDYEVFEQDWLVVIIDVLTNQKKVIVNDDNALKEFYQSHIDYIWVSFNGRNYDQFIKKAILCGFDPYKVSQFIITKKRKGWEYSNLFNQMQLYNYDVYKGITDVSLKTLEAYMGHNIHETSVPFNIKRKLNPQEILETIKYCTYDVTELIEVFKERMDDFETHLAMINEFELPLKHISKTSAQLISVILGSVKKEYDDEWDVYLPDTLRLSKYKVVADFFLRNKSTTNKLVIDVAGVEHTFSDGGLHGAKPKFTYICKPDEMMILADATSLYPTLMLVYDLLSRSISDKKRFKHIYDMNIELKRLDDPRRPIYKLICNTTYGCSGDKYNSMYDPRNRRLVCIFGQVLLLDLIEKLEPYIRLVQSNTDGILFIIKRKDFDVIDDIVHDWEERTGLTMEFKYYEKIFQKDVNNYVAVPYGPLYDEKGKPRWKGKGAYVKKLSRLDYDLPIVNEALINYMVKNIPIEDTINSCNELIKFQKIFKLTSNYEFVMHNGVKYWNKSYRVFASKNKSDTYLGKSKCEGCTIEKFANSPDHCFILNSDINGVDLPGDLDKEWYINLAYDRLNQFMGG